jgi:hypothetical protein
MINNDIESFTDSNDNVVMNHNYTEASNHVISTYEASLKKKKDAAEEKKKQKALDKFLESEEDDV